MSFSITEPSPRQKWVAGTLVVAYALITILPLVWIMMTGFKTPPDSISYPPKLVFSPSVEGYVNLFTTRTRVAPEQLAALPPPANFAEEIVRNRNMVIAGPSKFGERFMNSVIIGFGSTFLSILLGTLAAYAFSRFRIPLKDDLLFFILSTRMMPPIAVAIPIFLHFDGAVAPGAEAVRLDGRDIAVPRQNEAAEGRLVLGVRPEHVALSDDGAYRGRVLATEYLGTTRIITLETANGQVKARIDASQPAHVGEQVGMNFHAKTVTLFAEGTGAALRSALNEGGPAHG